MKLLNAGDRAQSARESVLVVEDDPGIRKLLERLLQHEEYEVHLAGDAETGLLMFDAVPCDLLILDITLPCMSGLSLCLLIRARSNVPILMLSARGDTIDKVSGLKAGADDYLPKPFQESELLARVGALLRRGKASAVATAQASDTIVRGALLIDRRSHRTSLGGHPLQLTPIEFNLLAVLASDAGRAFSRESLLALVWGSHYYGDERLVDTHIKHLRRKLTQIDPGYQPINSVRSLGYRFGT